MDASSVSAVFGSLKVAGDLTKALIGLRDESMIQAKVIELQSVIMNAQHSALAAQSDQLAMVNRVRELEEQVRRFEAWEAEKQRYEMVRIGVENAFAYALKASADSAELPHHICANCYNRGQKSTLQPVKKEVGRAESLACYTCGAEIYTKGVRLQEHRPITPHLGRRS